MDIHLPVLGILADWARGTSKMAPNLALDQLDHDKTEAKAQICAVMERLAHKHGLPLQQVDAETLSCVEEALDIVMSDREDELRAEIDEDEESELS
jgi:hypothetical protein